MSLAWRMTWPCANRWIESIHKRRSLAERLVKVRETTPVCLSATLGESQDPKHEAAMRRIIQ